MPVYIVTNPRARQPIDQVRVRALTEAEAREIALRAMLDVPHWHFDAAKLARPLAALVVTVIEPEPAIVAKAFAAMGQAILDRSV